MTRDELLRKANIGLAVFASFAALGAGYIVSREMGGRAGRSWAIGLAAAAPAGYVTWTQAEAARREVQEASAARTLPGGG